MFKSIANRTDDMIGNMDAGELKYFFRDWEEGKKETSVWIRKNITDLVDACVDDQQIIKDAMFFSGAMDVIYDLNAEEGDRTPLQSLLRATEASRYCKISAGSDEYLAYRLVDCQMTVATKITHRILDYINEAIADRVAFHLEQNALEETA